MLSMSSVMKTRLIWLSKLTKKPARTRDTIPVSYMSALIGGKALSITNRHLASDSSMTMTDSMSSMMPSEMEMSSTIALTSTYYDEDCSCTTTSVISTVIGMSGFGGASGTGAVSTGTAGGMDSSSTESSDSAATDGLDSDDDDDDDDDDDSDDDDSTSTDDAPGAISTGAASRNDVGSFIAAVGAIAFAAVAL